jgi:nitrogen fixation NifU-like protein
MNNAGDSFQDELYQEVLLQHSRRPRNFGPLEKATHRADGLNPLCGDEVCLQFRISGGRVEKAGFEGHACAICTASASILTMEAEGLTTDEVRGLASRFRQALQGGDFDQMPSRLSALGGVHRFPARVKCAVLPWEAAVAALDHPIRIEKDP